MKRKKLIASMIGLLMVSSTLGLIASMTMNVAGENAGQLFATADTGFPDTVTLWDQQQTNMNAGIGPIGQSFTSLAFTGQRFIAGQTGDLLMFSVYIESFQGGGNFYYDIRANTPSGSSRIGGFQSIPLNNLQSGKWNDIPLPGPTPLVDGNSYSIVLTADPGTNFHWKMEDPGAYPGTSYNSTDDSDWRLFNGASGDFTFKTFMEVPTGGLTKVAWHESGDYAIGVTGYDEYVYRYTRQTSTWTEAFNTGASVDHFKDVVYDDLNDLFYLVGESNDWPFAYFWSESGGELDLSSPPTQGGFYGVEATGNFYDGTSTYYFVAVGQNLNGKPYACWYGPGPGWVEVDGFTGLNDGRLNDVTWDFRTGTHYAVGNETANPWGTVVEISEPSNPAPVGYLDANQQVWDGSWHTIMYTGPTTYTNTSQRFVVENNGYLTSVSLYLSKDNPGVTTNLKVEIFQANSGGPFGSPLASVELTPAEVTTTMTAFDWVEATFPAPITVGVGEEYAVAVSMTMMSGDSYYWALSNPYYGPAEPWRRINNPTWNPQSSVDMVFRVFVTEDAPLAPPTATQRFGGNSSIPKLNAIDWCPNWDAAGGAYDYAIIAGDFNGPAVSNVFKYFGGTGLQSLQQTTNSYNDADWDPDGELAIIVGEHGLDGVVFHHNGGTDSLVDMSAHLPDDTGPLYGVSVKGPSSPASGIIVGSGGGVQNFPAAADSLTQVMINSAFPHVFSIDFWDATAPGASLLNTQVDVNENYEFSVWFNYTIGGVDSASDSSITIEAWFDEGQTGANSNFYPSPTGVNRTRQFNFTYSVWNNSAWMPFPSGAPQEFSLVGWNLDYLAPAIKPYSPDAEYILNITVSFENQTRAAPGDGGWSANYGGLGAPYPNVPLHTQATALDDANSWDFTVTVFDTNKTTASDTAYEEFGINTFTDITATGNPAGSIPPGAYGTDPLGWPTLTPSYFTYACNYNYYVNVSIVDFAGPSTLDASNCSVINNGTDGAGGGVISAWSNLTIMKPFSNGGSEFNVWGNDTTAMWSPSNGTYSAGNYSNYDDTNVVTYLYWSARVPAGIAEGTYTAQITYTAETLAP